MFVGHFKAHILQNIDFTGWTNKRDFGHIFSRVCVLIKLLLGVKHQMDTYMRLEDTHKCMTLSPSCAMNRPL